MLKVTVCIGSSCHIKGSRQVVEELQNLIAEKGLKDKIDLGGTFCMGKCQLGVCVTVGDDFFSVSPETVREFLRRKSFRGFRNGYGSGMRRKLLSSERLRGDRRSSRKERQGQ